jgi:hypothetical protein
MKKHLSNVQSFLKTGVYSQVLMQKSALFDTYLCEAYLYEIIHATIMACLRLRSQAAAGD